MHATQQPRQQMSGAVIEPVNWLGEFRRQAQNGDVSDYFGANDQFATEPFIFASESLRALNTLPVMRFAGFGAGAGSRVERVRALSETLSEWTERFDRALWQQSDSCASYIFALHDTAVNVSLSARASSVVLVTRRTYQDFGEPENDTRADITMHFFQVLSVAAGTALRHTHVVHTVDRETRQFRASLVNVEPNAYTGGVYQNLTPADAPYALRAQLKAMLLGAPNSQREAARLDVFDEEIADAIKVAASRGAMFAAVFDAPPGEPDNTQRNLAFLSRVAQFRDMALYQADPREADLRLDPDDVRADPDATGASLADSFCLRFSVNFLPGVAANHLYFVGWRTDTNLSAFGLNQNLHVFLRRWADSLYQPCVTRYLEEGLRIYEDRLEEEQERMQETDRIYNPQYYWDDEDEEEVADLF